MWFIYISIAVLFRGAFCNPVKKVAEQSNCTVVITRFGEQVTTLEVKWKSTINLICNASCVGPGPQPALTWFYRDKSSQSKLIPIERLFRSKKFATYPTNFHRRNELVIRDFGPNEETDFICNGSAKRHRMEAKVALIGTDCLLKYNFRCKLDNKCIDRAYLCNRNNECPDGEDEIGCDNNMNPTTTVATTRMPETSVGTEVTSDENDYNDIAKTVSTILIPQTDVKTEQISKQIVTETPPVVCTADQYKCANGECVDGRYRCDEKPDCSDGSDEENCLVTATPPAVCTADQYKCAYGECVDGKYRCDGKPDCSDGSDEENCLNGTICEPNEFQCPSGQCMMKIWRCNGEKDCTDGFDEQNCRKTGPNEPCDPDEFQCINVDQCIPFVYQCDKEIDCQDRSDEIGCSAPVIIVPPVAEIEVEIGETFTIICEAVGVPTPLIVWRLNLSNIQYDDRITTVSEQGRGSLTVRNARYEDAGAYTCEAINNRGSIYAIPDAIVIVRHNEPQTSRASKQKDDGKYDVTEEKTKTLMVIVGINVDGDNGLLPTTDGVTDNTGEYTDTTPFDYDFYAN